MQRLAIAAFVDELYIMAVVSIFKCEPIFKSLNIFSDYKQVAVVAGVVVCGGFALCFMAISKRLNLEIRWKNFFKDGRITLSMNDITGTQKYFIALCQYLCTSL